jgi:transglutaminase-like putative cysteine protease
VKKFSAAAVVLGLLLSVAAEARAAGQAWWQLGYRPAPPPIPGFMEPAWTTRRPERFKFHFMGFYTVKHNPRAEHVRIWLPLPADDGYQTVYLFRVEPAPARIITSRYGYRIAEFDFGALPARSAVTVEFDAEATIGLYPGAIDASRVGTLGEIPQQIKDDYLVDGPMYNIHEPAVAAAAREAVGDETNPARMMGRIAWWVRHHLRYQGNNPKRGAAELLQIGHGTCTEYSFLMIALARSLGLPARYLAGSPDRRRPLQRSGNDHNSFHKIVEVYLPGLGWTPVESSGGRPARLPEELVGWAERRMFIFIHEPEPNLFPLDPRFNVTTFVPFGVGSRLQVSRNENLQWQTEPGE